eukprot:2641938-Amphidinium_carterae.1
MSRSVLFLALRVSIPGDGRKGYSPNSTYYTNNSKKKLDFASHCEYRAANKICGARSPRDQGMMAHAFTTLCRVCASTYGHEIHLVVAWNGKSKVNETHLTVGDLVAHCVNASTYTVISEGHASIQGLEHQPQ